MGFKDKVVYQIYPKSFQDSNSDGWGDIRGIISRLDYLADLGINYIWFNPMTVSPQRDNGYDVADYRSFDPRYGTMEDFELLSAEAAKRPARQIHFSVKPAALASRAASSKPKSSQAALWQSLVMMTRPPASRTRRSMASPV